MFDTHDQFRQHLAMLLRDQPLGTSADLLDQTVAFWDGHRVVGIYLSADPPGLDEEFELTDEFLDQIPEPIADWLVHPKYTFRPELLEWLKDAPPVENWTAPQTEA